MSAPKNGTERKWIAQSETIHKQLKLTVSYKPVLPTSVPKVLCSIPKQIFSVSQPHCLHLSAIVNSVQSLLTALPPRFFSIFWPHLPGEDSQLSVPFLGWLPSVGIIEDNL